ncbi:mannose-1-phosphate guanylyltransferase/mannose-6-phosphate isomerase [Gammaproteobacteria bacterium]|nr:mannose-1-phosphate guanylyltransferase/mannose-6-phosphate isomerase [Gammaproteobacteria bacterium]
MKIVPVILAGGCGTRLWPLSRKQHPKQYLSLVGEHTMLQKTILRLDGLGSLTDPIIVCNAEHRFLVIEQCKEIDVMNPIILLEPVSKNTAPAIAASALQVLKYKNDKDLVLLVLSADHIIKNIKAFHQAIKVASRQAHKDKLVTFGIVPSDCNTGYGYLKYSKDENKSAYAVESFIEKPDLETVRYYLTQGNYLWNSGMFMFKPKVLIQELTSHASSIVTAVAEAVDKAKQDLDFIRLDREAFASSPSNSIDYALMERTDNLVVVPLDAEWSDIGSWNALYDIGDKDSNGNVVKGDVNVQDTVNCYINANHHMVVTIGVDDLIIVDTPDVAFIASKGKAHDLKSIVAQLQSSSRNEGDGHRKAYRPWGWYDIIEVGDTFQVKRLHINPGAKLSLQSHQKREEHWVVVSGVASVVKGDESFELNKGQSVSIEIGEKHSLANNSDKELEIIEVQNGEYLGEDDIKRFDDIYGR